MYFKTKKRIYQIVEKASAKDTASHLFDIFIVTLIIISVITVMLETVQPIQLRFNQELLLVEFIITIVFTAEYIIRLWASTAEFKYKHPILGRIKFALTPLLIIDLLSILPFYIPFFFPIHLKMIKALRLFRLLRIFKIARYSESVKNLNAVFKRKKDELLITLFAVFILLLMASSLMFYFENTAQPDAFASIPASMWWAISTLTTVGYGDVYPITNIGRILAGAIALLGIGIFALPAGIIASGYAEQIQYRKETLTCPHCKKNVVITHGKYITIPLPKKRHKIKKKSKSLK